MGQWRRRQQHGYRTPTAQRPGGRAVHILAAHTLGIFRAVAGGWLTLLLLGWGGAGLLMRALAPWLGSWTPTVLLMLHCLTLAAAGWVSRRAGGRRGTMVFAATLMLLDLEWLVSLNVPWLVRLAANSIAYPDIYFESLLTTAALQGMLLASVFAGAARNAEPVSLDLASGEARTPQSYRKP